MALFAAYLYLLTIAGVICFQIALISGMPWGHLTQGGRHKGVLPTSGRVAAGMSIVILLFMAGSVASAAGLWPGWHRATASGALGIQVVSMVANWATPSRPERRLWGPVNTLMLVLVVFVVFAS